MREADSQNWERLLSILALLAGVAALALSWQANMIARNANETALVANEQANQANLLAEEANSLALLDQLPDIRVSYAGYYEDYSDTYGGFCRDADGNVVWQMEAIHFYDISNLSRIEYVLVGISDQTEVVTGNPDISGVFEPRLFEVKQAFEHWMVNRGARTPGWYATRDQYSYGTPLIIPPGTVTRLVVAAKETAFVVNENKSPQQIFNVLTASGVVGDFSWLTAPAFYFEDGSVFPVTHKLRHPYTWSSGPQQKPGDFSTCDSPPGN